MIRLLSPLLRLWMRLLMTPADDDAHQAFPMTSPDGGSDAL